MIKQVLIVLSLFLGYSMAQAHSSAFENWEVRLLTTGPTGLDLSGSHLGGSSQITYPYKLGPALCTCIAQFSGAPTSGHMMLSSCTYQNATNSPNIDPGCSTLNKPYSYAEIGDRMTIMADDATSYINLGIWPVFFP